MEKGAWRLGEVLAKGFPLTRVMASGRGSVLSLAALPQAAERTACSCAWLFQGTGGRRCPGEWGGCGAQVASCPFSWRQGSVCGDSAPSTGSFHAREHLCPDMGVSRDSEPRFCSAAGLPAATDRPLPRTASCGFTNLQLPFPLFPVFSPLQMHMHSHTHGLLHVHIFLQTHTC